MGDDLKCDKFTITLYSVLYYLEFNHSIHKIIIASTDGPFHVPGTKCYTCTIFVLQRVL